MATKLESKVVRESSVIADTREIIVTLNENQTISMKLKGMKSGTVSIGIDQLWNNLHDNPPDEPVLVQDAGIDLNLDKYTEWEEEQPKKDVLKKHKGETMISVQQLRTLNAVTHSKIDVTVKLDEILSELLKK